MLAAAAGPAPLGQGAVVAPLAVHGALVGVAAPGLAGGRASAAAVLGGAGDGAGEHLLAAAAGPTALPPAVVAPLAVHAGCRGGWGRESGLQLHKPHTKWDLIHTKWEGISLPGAACLGRPCPASMYIMCIKLRQQAAGLGQAAKAIPIIPAYLCRHTKWKIGQFAWNGLPPGQPHL